MTFVDAYIDPYDDHYGEGVSAVPSGPSIPLPDAWQLYVRDSSYQRVAQVDDIVDLKVTQRWNDVDTWLLTLDADDEAVTLLANPLYGIELRYLGVLVTSGPCMGFRRTWQPEQNRVQFNGFSDDLWLSARVVQPTPATTPTTDGTLFTFVDDYDEQTGLTENVIKHYVDANLGPGAIASRRLAGLSIAATHSYGSTVTEKGRMQQLLSLIQSIATQGGDVGFRLQADPATGPVFDCFLSRDLSDSIVLSPDMGNVLSFEYSVQGPAANVVYEGSQDTGADRNFFFQSDDGSVSDWGRFESFSDERDTTDTETLTTRAQQTLDQGATATASGIVPNLDIANSRFVVDWMLGDTVTFFIDGTSVSEKIRQVEINIDDTRTSVGLAQTATGQAPTGPPWRALSRRLATRIRDLERRT